MRCSTLADELAEPMAGSVEERGRWLLVEDAGTWGEKAVRDLLGADTEARAKGAGIRLLLVRPRRPVARTAGRRAFLVDVVRRRAAARTIADPAEADALLGLDVDAFGDRVDEPMILVCTNGKRDACCALRGRALVAALDGEHAERTWECSHLGGHRFAGNLVCLPDGLVYGRVGPADGPGLVNAHLAGRVVMTHLRGRSAWPPPAQVAEMELRTRLGLEGLDDVTLGEISADDGAATVILAAAGGDHRVQLVAERGAPRPISCRADEPEAPLHWRVIGIG